MVQRKKYPDGKTIWLLETPEHAPAATRLEELQQVFNYYKDRPSEDVTPLFVLRLMALQNQILLDALKQQKTLDSKTADALSSISGQIQELIVPTGCVLDKPKKPSSKP